MALVDQDDLQRTDNYGRMLAVVWCGQTRVNEALIRAVAALAILWLILFYLYRKRTFIKI